MRFVVIRKPPPLWLRIFGIVNIPLEVAAIGAGFWVNHQYVGNSGWLNVLLFLFGLSLIFGIWIKSRTEFMTEEQAFSYLTARRAKGDRL